MGGYFAWAHKPFGAETILIFTDFSWPVAGTLAGIARTLGKTLLNILVWLGILWLAAATGRLLFQRALGDEDAATRWALYTGIGLGFISIVMGILGLLGLINRPVAWGFILLLILLLRQHIPAVWHDLRAITSPKTADSLQRLIRIYALITLSLTFIIALAPVTAFDSLTYHLRAPRFFIEAGKFVHPVDIPHMGFPLLGQMQFTLGMLLVGDGVTALFQFGYGLMTIALVAALAKRAFDDRAAWFSVMILLTIPTLFTLMGWPYVDVSLLFYTTAVFYTFMRWREKRKERTEERRENTHSLRSSLLPPPTSPDNWLILMGLMIGCSGGLKYTAVAAPIAITLSLIYESRRDGFIVIAKRLALVSGLALALVSPWLIENIITTGSPTYPFFFNDALYWDEWRAWWYDLPGTGLAATKPWLLLLVPLHATIYGVEGTPVYEATIGPFIFGALFILPFVWRSLKPEEKRILWHMRLFFAINYIFWLNGVARTALLLRTRFVFMVLGVTAVIGGLALSRVHTLKHPALDIGWMSKILLQITLIFLLFSSTMNFISINPLPSVLGFESADNFKLRRLGVYQQVMNDLNTLPDGSHITFFWETRSYDCRTGIICDPDPILDRFLHLTQFYEFDAAAIAQYLRQTGTTHILWANVGYDFLLDDQEIDPRLLLDAASLNPIGNQIRAEDEAVWLGLQANHLTQVAAWGNAYVLYEIKP
jgi:4-amino-4-deoxy-L-arabinose transferase-like glycosyltransferase